MEKEDLLFYDAYQEFYTMAENSNAFRNFCKDAFGADFSQDGFSDKEQIDRILQYIPEGKDVHILDIGCGNGKMVGYLQEKTGAYIHGFDYSAQAIATAKNLFREQADFQEGIIGEITYKPDSFDVITSMDTMYFAKDMNVFVGQLKTWLKKDGVFFVGYQEGDVIPKTKDVESTQIVEAFRKNQMSYEVVDITRQTYDLLVKKREAAIAHKEEFEAEGYANWYELLVLQTEYVVDGYEAFCEQMARYIFVARKM
ncbi:MAG: class I SAM-dependent methyltransferase [Eubacteriales bacterium]|nr:class I SAM-dependent methyltransferase [Eubacteriales bacterium]